MATYIVQFMPLSARQQQLFLSMAPVPRAGDLLGHGIRTSSISLDIAKSFRKAEIRLGIANTCTLRL